MCPKNSEIFITVTLKETTAYYDLGFVFGGLAIGSIAHDNIVLPGVIAGILEHGKLSYTNSHKCNSTLALLSVTLFLS